MILETAEDNALAEVIGFILIIGLVALVLMIWVTYSVPSQGRQAEIEHMNGVKDWFTDYKIRLDSLWGTSDAAEGRITGALISDSLDLGTLGANTASSGVFISLTRPIGSSGTVRLVSYGELLSVGGQNFSLPVLEYSAGNYYWVPQTYYYQMGGVFLGQSSGTVPIIRPDIAIENSIIMLTPVNLFNATGVWSFTGTSPVRIDTRLMAKQEYDLTSPTDLNFTLRDPSAAAAWKISLDQVCADPALCSVTMINPTTVKLVPGAGIGIKVNPANFTVAIQPAGSGLV